MMTMIKFKCISMFSACWHIFRCSICVHFCFVHCSPIHEWINDIHHFICTEFLCALSFIIIHIPLIFLLLYQQIKHYQQQHTVYNLFYRCSLHFIHTAFIVCYGWRCCYCYYCYRHCHCHYYFHAFVIRNLEFSFRLLIYHFLHLLFLIWIFLFSFDFRFFPPHLADVKQKNSSKSSVHDFILPTIWQQLNTNNSNNTYYNVVVLFTKSNASFGMIFPA